MKITAERNFCRVFEIHNTFPAGFLFEGGKDVNFKMIDWFYPIPASDIQNNEIKEWPVYVDMIKDFLLKKPYLKMGYNYLVITDFHESFILQKN